MLLSLILACSKPEDPIFTVAEAQEAVRNSSYQTGAIKDWDAGGDGILQRSELAQVDDQALVDLYNAIVSEDGRTWLRGSQVSAKLEQFITDDTAQNRLIEMPTPAVAFPVPRGRM